MKNLKFLLLIVFVNNLVIGQEGRFSGSNSGTSWARTSVSASSILGDVFKVRIKDDVIGSKYLYDSWGNNGSVSTKKGEKFSLNNLNLNLETGNFETEFLKDSIFIFNSKNIKEAQIANKYFVKRYNLKNKSDEFFELIYDKKGVQVYQKPILKIKEGVFNPLTQKKTPDELSFEYMYFVVDSTSSVYELKLNKKVILNFLSKNREQTTKFVKKNKLKYNNIDDLFILLDHFN